MKEKISGVFKDNRKMTKILIIAGIFLVALAIVGNVLGDDEPAEEPQTAYEDIEDMEEETAPSVQTLTEDNKALSTLKASAWVCKLGDDLNEYVVFEPDGFNNADPQMVQVYKAKPSHDIKGRYYDDTFYVVTFEEGTDNMFWRYDYGKIGGDIESPFELNGDTLKYNGKTYTAYPLDKLVHFSYLYGTGADEPED